MRKRKQESGRSTRPAVINCFYRLSFICRDFANKNVVFDMLVAECEMFAAHPYKDFYNCPQVNVWCLTMDTSIGTTFVPVKLILGRVASVKEHIKFNSRESDDVNVIFDLPSKS